MFCSVGFFQFLVKYSHFFFLKGLRWPNFTLHFINLFHTGSLSEIQNKGQHEVSKYFSFSYKSQFENFTSAYLIQTKADGKSHIYYDCIRIYRT